MTNFFAWLRQPTTLAAISGWAWAGVHLFTDAHVSAEVAAVLAATLPLAGINDNTGAAKLAVGVEQITNAIKPGTFSN
jgi:hypothetical protein